MGMRVSFCDAMVTAAAAEELVFLTGDLGFKALEPLRTALGERFINTGVAEQNMVSVAAGLARSGLRPWAYSIAPFLFARPFEQIRNDVCLHGLPVVLVGNGGGYGYGVMGATHHAIEDYGILLTLQGLRAYVPAFDGDVLAMVPALMRTEHPAYLRLGLSAEPKGMDLPPYAPWRRLINGSAATILVCGPLVGGIADEARRLPLDRRSAIWLLSELPVVELPHAFVEDVRRSQHLVVVEEHVAQGGVGPAIAAKLLADGTAPRRFTHRAARGYVSGRYGSQAFHRKENGLDPASILAVASGRQ
jgi:transketolase